MINLTLKHIQLQFRFQFCYKFRLHQLKIGLSLKIGENRNMLKKEVPKNLTFKKEHHIAGT